MKKQSGFSVIEIVMAIVIVGLIGAIGWMFWDKIASKSTNEDATKAASTESHKSAPTVSTKTYSAKSIGLAFDYPSTWKLTDATDYPFKSDSPNDVHKSIESPNGFSLVFSTISADGFGGTGPCPEVTGFKNYGESKLTGAYAISMDDGENGISLHLSNNKTKDDQSAICMYQNMIKVSEPKYASEDAQYSINPYRFSFGTFVSYQDQEQGNTIPKPSESELQEAAAILLSLRKQ